MPAALLLGTLTVAGLGCAAPQPPPSVLLVVVDTLRADHLGLYGHHRPTSPALDRRASQGAVFERAFSTSSWTLPAVGSILTGELPITHGARALDADAATTSGENAAIARRGKTFSRLRPGVPTLGELLSARGYATAAVTSNPFLDPRFGLDRGFDSYDQMARRRAPEVTDAALAWLTAHPEQRFFLLVHYMDPHLPYRPPAQRRGAFTAGIDSQLAPSLDGVQAIRKAIPDLSAADRDFLVASYDEEIAFVDGEIERLFAGLEAKGRWSDTLVVLTSDHGEEFFEHGGFEHGHSLYDEVLRVPLVVWGPRVRPGRRDRPASLADIAPTILDAAAVAQPPAMAGTSLWPALDGRTAGDPPTILAQDLLHGPDQLAALEWPHKVIVRLDTGALAVFDLDSDPAERDDLAAAPPAASRRLVARARAAAARVAAPAESLDLDAATLGELRALGYVD